MDSDAGCMLNLAWENPRRPLPWHSQGEQNWAVSPLVRLEVLLRLECPADFPYGENAVRDHVQEWLDDGVSDTTRAEVFRDSKPMIEKDLILEDLMASYRSVLVRLWVEKPCILQNGMALAEAKYRIDLRLSHVFREWLDSDWMARPVFRVRAMNKAPVPEWLAYGMNQLNMLWAPYAAMEVVA